jgi:hypothetical protein
MARRHTVDGALLASRGRRQVGVGCCPVARGSQSGCSRSEVVVIAMLLAAWVGRLASVGGCFVPLVGGHARRMARAVLGAGPVDVVVVGLRMKILSDLVGADNGRRLRASFSSLEALPWSPDSHPSITPG